MPVRVVAFVPHPSEPAFLTIEGALPQVEAEAGWRPRIEEALAARYGLRTHTLFCPFDQGDDRLYVQELAGDPPAGALWSRQEKAVPEPMQPVIRALLAEAESGLVPEARPAWARPGWRRRAEAWIRAQVDVTGPIAPVKVWSLSCVLRVPTPAGEAFFKVANPRPLFANEAVVTANLARRYPGRVPAPIALDTAQGWLLLPDAGPLIGRDSDGGEELRTFAALQAQSAQDLDGHLADGCLDRRLDVLAAQSAEMLADDAWMAALAAEETRDWRRLAERVPAWCDALAGAEVPATLVHGDLHGGNIARGPDGGLIFIDWTDACVAHPFFDLLLVHWDQEEARRERRLRAYLSAWTGVAPRERLRLLWDRAFPLLCLHHAVSYWYIDRALEPWSRPELGDTGVAFLRAGRAAAKAGEESACGRGRQR